ncbi:aca2fa22-c3ee-45fd-a060-ed797279f8c2 [Thermothielavioides terrestris]|uniref:Aca2fa22-c3ee-45fd-a060-ed797279f8c2 n=1 Tax=Thermothielavioides terrestris TaxID=2587410 RepID=A0A446BMN1_9PEZI|nr:aca2fa22-c3ee-45fd-a060-ed797279f8c2 [Thermothielavioides terrestris]
MVSLTHLPPEILHNIFSFVDPEDLARIPFTCRLLNNFIKDNNALCRAIYLRILDEPPTKDLNFEQELHELVMLKKICSAKDSANNEQIQSHLPFVYRTFTRLLNHAIQVPAPIGITTKEGSGASSNRSINQPFARKSRAQTFPASRNAALLATLFNNERARERFLTRSFIYELGRDRMMPGISGHPQLDAYDSESGSENDPDNAGRRRPRRSRTEFGWRKPRRPREAYQMSAKLHCLYGWGLGTDEAEVAPGAVNGEARRRAIWAARRGGGVFSLASSKVYDIREYTPRTEWGPFLDEDNGSSGVRVDWEKVEAILIVLGTNIRSKGLERFPIFWHFWGKPLAGCWDYSDFFNFNFPVIDRLPRDVPRAPLNAGQATRLILMRIRVTKIEPPGERDHPDHPVVYFEGFSRALDGSWAEDADANLRGTVRVTPRVRDFNPQGPCGPTAFWKISDRQFAGEDGSQVLLEDLFPLIADDMQEDPAARGSADEDLDQFGAEADWAEYEMQDELDALYYFDDDDIFDVEDGEAYQPSELDEVDDEDEDEVGGETDAEQDLP